MTRTHRFRPRFRGVAWTSIGLGSSLLVLAGVLGAMPLVSGAIGVAFGAAYLASGTWRLVVITDDRGISVRGPRGPKLELGWGDIVRVVASPSTSTCFVDSGSPETSLLVPGDGAPAPYDIEDRSALVATILERVTPDRVVVVETLDRAISPTKPA